MVASRILIVDDDAAIVEVLKAYLVDSVDEVLGVTDSRQGERIFSQFEPDLILLDLHMPDPDGLELLRRLRGARMSLGFLPVIVLTADTGHVARNSALILGAEALRPHTRDRERC